MIKMRNQICESIIEVPCPDEDDDDLYDKIIEKNRWKIVKYIDAENFFDKLREESHFNLDDCEDIRNTCPTRRKKAGKFLDVLQTKGCKAVQSFLDIMEFECPEVFEIVTKKMPRKPPPNFQRKSQGLSFRLISKLPDFAKKMQEDYKMNQELKKQLEEMANGLTFEHSDNIELERENDELRRKTEQLEKNITDLEGKVGELVKDNHRLQEEQLQSLKTCLEYSKQSDLYGERWRQVQVEKDDLDRQIKTLREQHSSGGNGGGSFHKKSWKMKEGLPVSSQDSSIELQQRAAIVPANLTEGQNLHDSTQREILSDKLSETQQQLDETCELLDSFRSEKDEFETLYRKGQKQIDSLRDERDQLDAMLKKQKESNKHYFEIIENLETEKKSVEEERIKAQRKASEESEKRNVIFKEKHELECELCTLELKYTTLKSELANRNSELSNSSNESDGPYLQVDMDADIPSSRMCSSLPAKMQGLGDKKMPYTSIRCQSPTKDRSKMWEDFSFIPGNIQTFDRSDTVKCSITDIGEREFEEPCRRRLDTVTANIVSHTYIKDASKQDAAAKVIKRRSEKIGGEQWLETTVLDRSSSEEIQDQSSVKSDDSLTVPEVSTQYEVLEEMIPVLQQKRNSQSQIRTIKMPTPFFDKIEICGGNMVGIYIKRIIKKNIPALAEGDKILSIGTFISNNQALHTDLTYRTFEEAKQLIINQANPKHANMVELRAERDTEEFQKAQKWMLINKSFGDFFFIKSNFAMDGTQGCCKTVVKKGDIYCVTATMPYPEKENKTWEAYLFDQTTNTWEKEKKAIPNISEVLRITRGQANTSQLRRRDRAFRHRPYSRVLPMQNCGDLETKEDNSSTKSGAEAIHRFPTVPSFKGNVHWVQENKLDDSITDNYRYILGYTCDPQFNISIDLQPEQDVQFTRSMSEQSEKATNA